MGLESRVVHMVEEIEDVKRELGHTRAALREVLDRLRPPTADGSQREPAAFGHAQPMTAGGDGATDENAAVRPTPVRQGGGVSLSQGDLATILEQAQARAGEVTPDGHASAPTVSLQGLADAMEAARQGVTDTERSASVTLSLPELARMMKAAQAGEAPSQTRGPHHPKAQSPNNGKATRPLAAAVGNARLRDPSDQARLEQGRAATSERRHMTMSALRSSVQDVAPKTGPGTKMDVNLLVNLTRWVGQAKRTLGVHDMHSLVQTYRLTGHLPSMVEKAIYDLARMGALVDESEYHGTTHDDLIDFVQRLHGIVYGAGSAPILPEVELDRGQFAEGVYAQAEGHSQEEVAAEPADEATTVVEQVSSQENDWDSSLSVRDSAREERVDAEIDSVPKEFGETLATLRRALLFPPIQKRPAGTDRASRGDSEQYAADAGTAFAAPVGTAAIEQPTNGRPRVGQTKSEKDRKAGAAALPDRTAYPSDLTDSEWRKAEPLVPPVKPGGRPSKYDRREILNGILYQARFGCSWRSLPHDLPPWKIVHHYSRTWREDGSWEPIMEMLTASDGGWVSLDTTPRAAELDGPGLDGDSQKAVVPREVVGIAAAPYG